MTLRQGHKLLQSDIYILKINSSQEPIGQFQLKLVGNMLGGWGSM